nr:hypothetical protein Itr_chr13CG16440 [Ipomoea trifida]
MSFAGSIFQSNLYLDGSGGRSVKVDEEENKIVLRQLLLVLLHSPSSIEMPLQLLIQALQIYLPSQNRSKPPYPIWILSAVYMCMNTKSQYKRMCASVFSSGGGDAASLPTANSDPRNWLLSPLAVEIHQNVGAGSALLILGHRILRITYLYNELSTANLLHRHYDFKIHQKVYQKRFQFLVAYERNLQRINELVKWVAVSLSAGLRHQLVQVLLLPHPRPPRRLPVRLHPLPHQA